MKRILVLAFATLIAASVAPAPRRRAVVPGLVSGLSVSVPKSPQAVTGDGRQQVFYELVVRNDRNDSVTITSVEVISPSDNTTLATYPGQQIAAHTSALFYIQLTFNRVDDVPPLVSHRLRLTGETFGGPVIPVTLDAPPVLSAPMRGRSWLAANGPANNSPHRRAAILINGRFMIAQRLAIDWVQLDERGSTSSGDRRINSSYYAYGQQVLAAGDGVIASVHDGIPENVPQQTPVVPITLETAAGNYVILDLGDSRFALYAHLQPGSLLIHTGDHVTAGAPLALLGNSGNSSEPHLHFHLCDANSALACEGIPWVFDHFATSEGSRQLEIPMANELIDFEQ